MTQDTPQHVTRSERDGVTVLTLVHKRYIDESVIQQAGHQIFSAIEESPAGTRFVLDMEAAEYFSSAMFGKMITMDKKVKAGNCKLRLANVHPAVYETMAIIKMARMYDMHDSLANAVETPWD